MIFMCANSPLIVEITQSVLGVLNASRQSGVTLERGGQLFATVTASRARITRATTGRAGDRATRTSFVIDRKAAQREIDLEYALGRHYIGDWHTHPVDRPISSTIDRASMAELYKSSRHDLLVLVMIIVGREADPSTWWCSLHSGDEFLKLEPRIV